MISYTELKFALTSLGLTNNPVIVHASLRAFGPIDGGAGTLIKILLASTRGGMMPSFTSGSPILAFSEAMRISQARASSSPPPRA